MIGVVALKLADDDTEGGTRLRSRVTLNDDGDLCRDINAGCHEHGAWDKDRVEPDFSSPVPQCSPEPKLGRLRDEQVREKKLSPRSVARKNRARPRRQSDKIKALQSDLITAGPST